MVPVARIPEQFPMIYHLDLSCQVDDHTEPRAYHLSGGWIQAWGYGQNLTPASGAQLSALQKLRHLRSIKLTNWSTLPLNGFQTIVGLKSVTELDLTNCRSVGDNYLRCFRSISSKLKLLILSGCSKITDRGITHLSALQHLTELRYDEWHIHEDRFLTKGIVLIDWLALEA